MGLGASSGFWADAPERLARAAAPYRVLAVDNRGTGRSDDPRVPFTVGRMADDAAAVLDHAGVDRAFVVGMSMGGMIAQELVLRHPHRAHALVLMCTTAGLAFGPLVAPRIVRTLLSAPFARGQRGLDVASALLLHHGRHEETRADLRAFWPVLRNEKIRPRGFFLQVGAVLSHSTAGRLGRVACPTLVVTGDGDPLVPPGHSRFLASRIPGARLHVLSGVGHGINITDPDALRRSLDFVRHEIVL
jgi:pimeloyl-ACP methyl ester carboxylesterase